MAKRIRLLLGAAVLLALALLAPHRKMSSAKVFQQHEQWPAESQQVRDLQQQGVFATHLPIVILHNDGRRIPGVDRTEATDLYCGWTVIHEKNGVNRLDAAPAMTGRMNLSVRGNSSRDYPKKQYMVKLVDGQNAPRDEALLGMPAESTWVLNGSYIDKSLIRNYMCYNLAGQIMDYAPRCRLCEVFTTDPDGKPVYQGVYTLMEKIKVSDVRLDLEKYTPGQEETSFMVQMNSKMDNLRLHHLKPDGVATYPMDLEYPDVGELQGNALNYIRRQLAVFEKSMYDAVRAADWSTFNQYADLDSFVDYYIINEFFQNLDAGTRSTYLYQEMGGKMAIGPVWDFDGALNNFADVENRVDYLKVKSTFYYRNLFQDPEFVERCIARYHELRRGCLSDRALLAVIVGSGAYLQAPARRNAQRWYGGDAECFEEELEELRTFVVQRGRWMDENFERLCAIIR